MGQRIAQFVSSSLNFPLWLAIVVAMAGCVGLIVLDALGTLYSIPGAQSVLSWCWFALMVVYFSGRAFRYYRGRKTSLLEVLGIVAVLHGFAVLSLFYGPLAHGAGRVLFAELIDLDFRLFIWIFVSLWAVICTLLLLRYERLGRFGVTRGPLVCAIVICGLLLLVAAAVQAVVPGFRQIYEAFGADVPQPTMLMLSLYPVWYAIPVLGVLMAGCIPQASGIRLMARAHAFDGLIGLLVVTNLFLIACLSVMFLPLFPRCGALLETGFSGPHHEAGFTRLHAAASLGRADSVQRLIARSEPLEIRDIQGLTPLQYAVSRNHTQAVRTLLRNGAQAGTFDPSGRTPLHTAVAVVATRPGASLELVELLLNHGAPIDASTESGITALHIAVLYGRGDIATLLLLRGADVNAIAAQGTPLDSAHLTKNHVLAGFLLEHGAVRATEQEREAAKQRVVQPHTEQSGFCG